MANKSVENISDNGIAVAERYGEMLKKYRREDGGAGISQETLAQLCGVSQPSISAIEKGLQLPSPKIQIILEERYSISLAGVRNMVDETPQEPLIITQMKSFLDGHQNLSQECLEAMKAAFLLFAKADLHGDLGAYFPTDPDQKLFQAYGWDFTLRIALDEFKKNLAGRIEYERMGIIRRKINGNGLQEGFMTAAKLPLFTTYDSLFDGPGAYTKGTETYKAITGYDTHTQIHWLWHELRKGPREESLLFLTRGGEESEPFNLTEQDIISSTANRYIQEVIGISDAGINNR